MRPGQLLSAIGNMNVDVRIEILGKGAGFYGRTFGGLRDGDVCVVVQRGCKYMVKDARVYM